MGPGVYPPARRPRHAFVLKVPISYLNLKDYESRGVRRRNLRNDLMQMGQRTAGPRRAIRGGGACYVQAARLTLRRGPMPTGGLV